MVLRPRRVDARSSATTSAPTASRSSTGASGVGKSSSCARASSAGSRDEARANVADLGVPRLLPVVFAAWSLDDPLAALRGRRGASRRRSALARRPPAVARRRLVAWRERIGGPLLLVLDQFEELLPLPRPPGRPAPRGTRARAAQPRPAVHFLLSIREDSLAQLDRFKGRVPGLLDHLLRIDHLDRDAAREAIVGRSSAGTATSRRPASEVETEPALVKAVLDQVETGTRRRSRRAAPRRSDGARRRHRGALPPARARAPLGRGAAPGSRAAAAARRSSGSAARRGSCARTSTPRSRRSPTRAGRRRPTLPLPRHAVRDEDRAPCRPTSPTTRDVPERAARAARRARSRATCASSAAPARRATRSTTTRSPGRSSTGAPLAGRAPRRRRERRRLALSGAARRRSRSRSWPRRSSHSSWGRPREARDDARSRKRGRGRSPPSAPGSRGEASGLGGRGRRSRACRRRRRRARLRGRAGLAPRRTWDSGAARPSRARHGRGVRGRRAPASSPRATTGRGGAVGRARRPQGSTCFRGARGDVSSDAAVQSGTGGSSPPPAPTGSRASGTTSDTDASHASFAGHRGAGFSPRRLQPGRHARASPASLDRTAAHLGRPDPHRRAPPRPACGGTACARAGFSPDGTRVVTAGDGGEGGRLGRAGAAAACSTRLPATGNPASCGALAFSRDGQPGRDRRRRRHRAGSGTGRRAGEPSPGAARPRRARLRGVGVDPDGERVVYRRRGRHGTRLGRPHRGEPARPAAGMRMRSGAPCSARTGGLVATAGDDGTGPGLGRREAGETLHVLRGATARRSRGRGLQRGRDAGVVTAGDGLRPHGSGTTHAGDSRLLLHASAGQALSVGFEPRRPPGRRRAGRDGTTHVWDARTGRARPHPPRAPRRRLRRRLRAGRIAARDPRAEDGDGTDPGRSTPAAGSSARSTGTAGSTARGLQPRRSDARQRRATTGPRASGTVAQPQADRRRHRSFTRRMSTTWGSAQDGT